MRLKCTYILLLMSFLISFNKGQSQSLPMYSQYMYNMVNINPAYAGNRGVPSATLLWREQWAGMPGAPSTKSLSLDLPNSSKTMGYGVQFFDDKYANVLRRTGVNLFYNIKVKVTENGVLGLGFKGGFYNNTKNLTNVDLGPVPGYDLAFASNINKIVPQLGTGVYYNDDHFYLGVSMPDVITFLNKQDKNIYQVVDNHFFLTSGYSFNVNEDLEIKPSVMLKAAKGAPLAIDYNTNVWLKNKIGVGVSYRKKESVLALLELQANPKLRIGYAYDMPFNKPNSHELFLRFEFGDVFPSNKTFKIF
jgi:type IX secretion system PorP/SprF family membrane protein